MRSIRLLAPVGVAGAIAIGAWVPTITAAGAATPDLPSLTAQQLLAKVQTAHVAGLSGTVRWSANLGLPDLSGITGAGGQGGGDNAFDPTTLLTGSHDISVWDAGATKQRLALPGTLNEVDVVHNGKDAWFYDSSTQKVTHYTQAPGDGAAKSGWHGYGGKAPTPAETPMTPDQVAQKVLAGITPSTTVTVASPVYVAGRPTYELVVAPKAAQSTIKDITIAVDSATGVPLRVQVTPKGTTTAALSLGFKDVKFSVPAASNFAAPIGTSSTTKTLGGPGEHARGAHRNGPRPPEGSTPDAARKGQPTVTGSDWGSIVTVTSANLGSAGHRLDQISTTVHGSFGTAKLVSTNLFNALILPDGRVLAGFVTPAALEAAAGSAG